MEEISGNFRQIVIIRKSDTLGEMGSVTQTEVI